MPVPDYNDYSENELLNLAKQGNDGAFKEIFDRFWGRLFSTAMNIFRDDAIAKDIVQEVFVFLWSRMKDSEIHSLSSYLHQAVKLRAFRYLRDGKLREEHHLRFERVVENRYFENAVEREEMEYLIKEAVNSLPERSKEIFIMSRLKQMKAVEIASELNIAPKTVEGHLTKALKQVRLSLNNFL